MAVANSIYQLFASKWRSYIYINSQPKYILEIFLRFFLEIHLILGVKFQNNVKYAHIM